MGTVAGGRPTAARHVRRCSGAADAIEVDPWFGDPPRRSFTGATLFDGHVKIVGWQDPDGAIERRIVVGVDDLELTAGDAIRLCRAVSAAADEIKRLEG